MAKKKIKKKRDMQATEIQYLSQLDGKTIKKKVEKKEALAPTKLDEISDLWASLQMREMEIRGLHERIDRLVDAIDKCKRVKGI